MVISSFPFFCLSKRYLISFVHIILDRYGKNYTYARNTLELESNRHSILKNWSVSYLCYSSYLKVTVLSILVAKCVQNAIIFILSNLTHLPKAKHSWTTTILGQNYGILVWYVVVVPHRQKHSNWVTKNRKLGKLLAIYPFNNVELTEQLKDKEKIFDMLILL